MGVEALEQRDQPSRLAAWLPIVVTTGDSSDALDSTSFDRASEAGEALAHHHLRESANGVNDEMTWQLDISTFENNNGDISTSFK